MRAILPYCVHAGYGIQPEDAASKKATGRGRQRTSAEAQLPQAVALAHAALMLYVRQDVPVGTTD